MLHSSCGTEYFSVIFPILYFNFFSLAGPVLETEASSPDDYENAPSSCSPSGEDLHRQVS